MHFHEMTLCMHCGRRAQLSTPVPNILILSEMCQGCGWNDLIGTSAFEICRQCRDMWVKDVEREKGWVKDS